MVSAIVVSVCAALFMPSARELPSELAHLATLTGSEADLVEAVRRFDRQQLALVDWDRRLLTDYSENGPEDLAVTKVQDIRRRIALVREAWLYVLGYYPNNALANNYYGELQYDHLDDPAGGVQSWLLATRLDEKLGLPHNNLALHYVHVGQIDNGLRHLAKALDLEPKNPDFLYNGAQLYLNYFPRLAERFDFKKERLYKEAMRMSRDAARLAPDDFQIVQDYAVNFYASENFGVEPNWKEAAEAWQKAEAIAPGQEEKFYTVLNEARAWKRAGDTTRATEALNRALSIRPDSEVAQRLLGELRMPVAPAATADEEPL